MAIIKGRKIAGGSINLMARKIALWASFIALPAAVIIAGPSLINGFGVAAPVPADALAVVRNGGFVASCAPAFAAYAKAAGANADAIRCTQGRGEAIMQISFTHTSDALRSTDNSQIALAIPVEYGKRFQGRAVVIEITAKCPKAACDVVASVNTGYTDKSYLRSLRFVNEFTTNSFEFSFLARDPDDIVGGPSIAFSPSGENADFDLAVKSLTMTPADV